MSASTSTVSPPGARPRGTIVQHRWLAATIVFLLVGSWGMGKGFAYVGYYPVLISDVLLALTLTMLLRRGLIGVPLWSARLLVVLEFLLALQVAISIILLRQPATEVLRNVAPILTYPLFACASYFLLTAPYRRAGSRVMAFDVLGRLMPRAVRWVLVLLTLNIVLTLTVPSLIPRWKPAGVPALFFKATDAAVPLLVVVTLWLRRRAHTAYFLWALPLLLVCVFRSRGALLATIVVLCLLRRPGRRFVLLVLSVLLALGIVVGGDVQLKIGGYREISRSQIIANAGSLLGVRTATEHDPSTQHTVTWRWEWWGKISRDSFRSVHPLIGLGWGANLATRYGFETGDPSDLTALRNPHNMAMGVLGRGGWVVLFLWAGFYAALLAELVKAMRLTVAPRRQCLRTLLELSLVVVVGGMVLGLTDVFLESPQNAIPHWLLVGVGWAAIVWARLEDGSRGMVDRGLTDGG